MTLFDYKWRLLTTITKHETKDAIFQGQYGSENEQQLEKELDWLLEQKHHVDQAHFRWKQAQLLSRQASGQLAEAVQKWKDLLAIASEWVHESLCKQQHWARLAIDTLSACN